jgi:hypothetical protein
MYCFVEHIWKWDFKEPIQDMDQGYRSSDSDKQELWAYKQLDSVFGFPSIVRFTHAKVKTMLLTQVASIEWAEGKSGRVRQF